MSQSKTVNPIWSLISLRRLLAFAGLGILLFLAISHPLSAETITQSFKTDQALQRGMIVRLKKGDASKVELASSDNPESMYGVTVDGSAASLTLSGNEDGVFVATSGHFDVVVSDQAGNIKQGDYITVSALSGVGMRAQQEDIYVIGRALSSFDASQNTISKMEIKGSNGSSRTVNIGRVLADITVARNPSHTINDNNLPEFLRKASENAAGKSVSAWRVYAAAGFFA